MLIQSSLPNSIRAPLSFVSDHEKQENSDLLSDWTHYSEIQQNSKECDECCWDGCRKFTSTRTEKDNAAITDSARSNISASEDLYACSVAGRSEYVYKRRRKKEETAMGSTKRGGSLLSSISSEQLTLIEEKCDHLDSRFRGKTEEVRASVLPFAACETDLYSRNPDAILSTQIIDPMILNINSKCDSMKGFSIREDKGVTQPSTNSHKKLALEHCTIANDSCSSSKSNVEHGSAFTKTEADDTAECSSSDIVVSELLRKCSSEKELCVTTRSCDSIEGDTSCSKSCKICGLLDNQLKMLICDLCEEAFHLFCCNPQIKQIPVDEWYCRSCMKKKPKPLLEITTPGKTLNIMSETPEYRKYGPISFMLKDVEPYTTGVRIGKSFQADVPDWSGPISNNSDKIGEPLELDPVESVSLNEWNSNQSSRHGSIGNWLQCQEVIYESTDDDVGVVCGKWRRAPLFEVQTDDWDCSCAVVWDPIHADCAVPQELGTAEVMMHLKYIQLLRPRLDAKKPKLALTKSRGSG